MLLKKIFQTFPVLLCIITLFRIPVLATESQTIRVAYILDHGFYVMEENGGLSGYNYDFLMMIAQHTGWDYEFVQVDEGNYEASLKKSEKLLQNGDVDLLGTIYKTEETLELYEFPELHTGINRHVLVSLANNYKITQDNYFLQDIITIALVKDASINDIYHTLLELRGLDYDITYVDTYEEALQLLIEEKVSTILTTDTCSDIGLLNQLTIVDRVPFYFVASKGNTPLISKLDEAIYKVNVQDPELHQNLLSKYFGKVLSGEIILTKEEEKALDGYDYLTVGLLKGREPYQFLSEDNDAVPQGISVEILEQISSIIGVEFRYVWLDSRQEVQDKIASREIDIYATTPFDSQYELTYALDVVVTKPYLTNAVVWLHQSNEIPDPVPCYYFITENIPFYPDEELIEVFNFQEALIELSTKGETSLFTDPYMAQYYIQKLGLTNVEMQTVNAVESKICFGIGKHLDTAVVGLLNHALQHLDQFVVDEIIYNNVTVQTGVTMEAFFREHTFEIIASITFLFAFIVGFLVWNGLKLKKISQQDSLTKLYNAGYFHQYAGEKSKKVSQGCLILIDIDYFKQVNDTYGHQEGDAIIIKVATALKRHFRSEDVIARLGGDEFIIYLENNQELPELERRCERILAMLADKESKVPVTLSIGGYLFKENTDYKTLYQLADEALYRVKEQGRNNFFFSEQ